MDHVAQLPYGDDSNSLPDNAVILVGTHASTDPADVVRQIEPRESKAMVAVIRHRDDRARWNGVVHFDDRTLPLDGIRIIRPEMRHLERSSTTAISPNDELRLSRTIGALTYPIWKKDPSVSCAGDRVRTQWNARRPAIRLTLVDPDQLDLHNL